MSDFCAAKCRATHSCAAWMPWLVCLSAGLFFLYEFFQLNLFDVINTPLREAFNISAAEISWMSSTYVWANVLFLLPAGMILDRFSTRNVILSAMALCIIGTLGFGMTKVFSLAAFFHAMTGIGNAFGLLSCVILISRWFPPQRQAFMVGSVVTMAFLGGMLAHTPLAWLSAQYGWRNALFIDAIMGVVFFIWILMVVKDRPNPLEPLAEMQNSKPFSGFMQSLLNRQNWLAGLFTACLNLPIMVLCALWGASYLQNVHQLPPIAASNIVSMILMGSIFGCPFVGWLSDYVERRKPIMILGAIATALTTIPLFMEIALSDVSLSCLFFALGFFTSTQVIAYPLVAESNPAENTGVATGIASLIIMAGGGVGQIVFGLLMGPAVTGQQYNIANYQTAMLMFPITAIIALIAVGLARETFCKPNRDRSNDGND